MHEPDHTNLFASAPLTPGSPRDRANAPLPLRDVHPRSRGAPPRNRHPKSSAPTGRAVLVVHGSPILRVGVATVVNSGRHFFVCGEAGEAACARELFGRLRPDVVVLGLSLSHGDGIELLKDLNKQRAAVPALVITAREDPLSLQRAFRAGARGYVLATDGTAELLRALASVSAGEFYASPSAGQQLLAALATGAIDPACEKVAGLSDRELQVFRLIGRGLGATKVAAELRVSVKTVESHRTHIKEKLGLATGAELNARAERWLLDAMRPPRRPLGSPARARD